MKKFELAGLLGPCQTLSRLRGSIENAPHNKDQPWNKGHPDYAATLPLVIALPGQLREIELEMSARCADRLADEITGTAIWSNIRARVMHLEDTLRDELEKRTVLIVDSGKQEFFLGVALNEHVRAVFAAAIPEMNEAAKCIALDRNTGSVFHMMRALEMCVQKLGTSLHVKLAKLKPGKSKIHELTWGDLTSAIRTAIDSKPKLTLQQKRRHERYSAVLLKLDDVREAWRNPTMHPSQRGYNDLEAQDILNRVCSFMRELSTLFPART